MNIIHVANYEELSKKAAQIIGERIKRKPAIAIGFATGGTPIGTYKELRKLYEKKEVSFEAVTSFNLDEYLGLPPKHEQSYSFFMFEQLFQYVNIPSSQIHFPDGMRQNRSEACAAYEEKIAAYGGIDIQLLGIGNNGHIAFNEPGTSFNSRTHVVELSESTREANARFFTSLHEVPESAISMGIGTIMECKEILLLISGRNKKEAYEKLMNGEVHEGFPASILHTHPNVTILIDEAASK